MRTAIVRSVAAVGLLVTAPLLHGQTFSFSKTVIDPNPGAAGSGPNYDKLIGHFTSTSHFSYFLGSGNGAYLYDTTTGRRITIRATGSHYERAKVFLYPGDTYPGIIASVSNKLVWYRNPANSNGGNADAPWDEYIINGGSGCHDLQLADLDGDRKQDILCSATSTAGRMNNFVAFQNAANDWQIVSNFNPSGDAIALVSINGANRGARTNIVACDPQDSELYWYKNPGGRAARDPGKWTASQIGGCNPGVAIGSLHVGNRDIVIVASNETQPEAWPEGLAYYDPGSTPYRPWEQHIIDPTYRDVHQVTGGTISGVPFFTVGEQEQASSACNDLKPRANNHPTVDGCRVAVFPWTGRGFGAPTLLSTLGTQNQEVLLIGNTAYMIGANHAGYGAADPALNLWQFQVNTGKRHVNRDGPHRAGKPGG